LPYISGSKIEVLMEIAINKLIVEDIDQVIQIEKEVFSNPWEESAFYSSLDHSCCWKLSDKLSKKIIGYLIGQQVLDEFSIYNLAICREYQNQGLGSWFTRKILNEMRDNGSRVFFLEVRRSNEAALQLYGNLGFKEAHVRRGYYSNPVEDALIMIKDERNYEKG